MKLNQNFSMKILQMYIHFILNIYVQQLKYSIFSVVLWSLGIMPEMPSYRYSIGLTVEYNLISTPCYTQYS